MGDTVNAGRNAVQERGEGKEMPGVSLAPTEGATRKDFFHEMNLIGHLTYSDILRRDGNCQNFLLRLVMRAKKTKQIRPRKLVTPGKTNKKMCKTER